VDFDAVADELYALPPGRFVAARDERVAQARADGDRELAKDISALRRPTVVAWLANLLTRRHPEDVEPFLELGAALRDATATLSGPELKELSRQRQQLVHALVRKARALGEAEGQRVGEDSARGLEETLHAALADPDAAQELLDGRLTGALNRAGFGEPGAGAKGSPARREPVRAAKRAAGRSASEAKAAEDERQAARRARIERDLGEAWSEARRTAEERDALDAEARAADKRRAEAAREVRRLREDLQRAEQSLVDAEQSESAAARARDRAEKKADRARQRVTDLQARLDEV
jgi:hypothetical protein